MNWFSVTIAYLKQIDNGSVIKKSEEYILNSMSFTETEARLAGILESYIPEYELLTVKKIKLTDIVFNEEEETWYKVKMAYVSYDEDSGKEKKINETFMVASGSAKDVHGIMEGRMEGSIVDWEITNVAVTKVLDIFPYEEDKVETATDEESATA